MVVLPTLTVQIITTIVIGRLVVLLVAAIASP